jgi:hypothetical protein
VSDLFPERYAVLFRVPESVDDTELHAAVEELAESLKADLVACGAPVEVIMEASVCLNQFAKHMQASRQPYGRTELGAYGDPGSERAALSSLHNGLSTLREALFKLRVVKASPAQIDAARDEQTAKFRHVCTTLFQAARAQVDPLRGEDLMFWVQGVMFPVMQEEGLAE